MSRATTPGGVIHALADETPELALLTAVVRLAVEDAGRGDPEARQWLASVDCLACLSWIAPDMVDPRVIQRRILDALPPPRPWQTGLDIEDEDDAA